MDEEEVSFLRGGAAISGDDEIAGGEALGLAAAAAEEGDGLKVEFVCFVQGGENVGGITAGGEDDEQITGPGEAGDLAGEGVFVAVIVDHAGEEGAIGVEGDGRQGTAVLGVAADKFGGEMSRLGRAATIAADEEFAAAAEGREDQLGGAVDLRADFRESVEGAERVGERGFEGAHGVAEK